MKRILTLLFLLPLFAAGQCDTVTGLTATGVGHASATISFTAPSASLYFVLIYNGTREFRNYPGGTYPALVIAPLVNLTPSTAYTYTIVRYCSGSDSAESSDYYFTTTAPPCDTVTNVAASVTSNSVSITSTAAAYGDSYVIYYVRDGQTDTTTEAGADEDFQLANLRPNTVYWYQIGTICGSDTTRNTRRSFTTSNSPAYTPSYNFGWQYKRLAPDSTLNIPTMATPSLKNGKNDKAAFIYDTVYGAPAVFDPLTQTWDYLSTQDSSIVTVATVSALSSYGGNATTVIVTDSLRGGVFNYYASGLTTDSGVVFSATGKGSGYWRRQYTQAEGVNVEWWGAVPDSSTFCSAAIQSAIDYQYNNGGGFVYFNAGSYVVDTTIKMKRGVYLTNQTSSYNVSDLVLQVNAKGTPTLVAKTNFSGDVILFDFQTSNEWAPWAGGVMGIAINCTSQISGDGIHFNQPSPTFGPANDGVVYGGIRLEHISIVKAFQYGIYAETKVNGIFFKKLQVRESGSHGIYVGGTDLQLDEIYSWKNGGAGFYTFGTTNRMYRSDFWDNVEGGIIDEGLVNNYIRVQCDNNFKHGIWFKKGTTYATYSRNHLLNGCRFLANGRTTDSTYSEVYIDSTNDYAITVSIVGCDFSYATSHSNWPAYCVDAQYNPAFVGIVNCFFGSSRRYTYPVSDIIAKYADLQNNRSGTNLIGNKPILVNDGGTQINANVGRVFETQNTSATTITNIGGGRPGQQIVILVGDNNTSFSFATTLKSNYRTTYAAKNTDIITAFCEDGVSWYLQVPAQDTSFWNRSNNVLSPKTTADTVSINKTIINDDPYFLKRQLLKDTTVTANYTATNADHHIKVDATSGNITVFIPNPFYPTFNGSQFGGQLVITRIDNSTNTVTIQPGSGTVSINGAASITIKGNTTAVLRSGNSTNWYASTGYQTTDGMVPTSKLGTGTASSSTVLYGNSTWAAPTGFQVQLTLNSLSPNDATTYFIGSIAQLSGFNSGGNNRFYFTKAGTIKVASVYFYAGGAGSSETSTISIRLNNTTDYQISASVTNDATNTHFSNTAMSVPISVGDYVEIKWVTPTWTSNPTAVRCAVMLYIE